LNLHVFWTQEPESCASANFATAAALWKSYVPWWASQGECEMNHQDAEDAKGNQGKSGLGLMLGIQNSGSFLASWRHGGSIAFD
jgi:hypothetical protein